ncbi:MAG TPA: SUMF1/EgtB/PvdO family nonheme iron enzyme [Blastocatellia bacterium]|nr:SUMF1/EgtB/PvdO family nonheme iron enzyme [Blastocatellia bacterium]
MMYCERCNIDFPEGLRYCKWCGQTLVERRRNTSELHFCPNCAAAVQPRWAFCKVCGVRLATAPREAVAVACPQCGTAANPGALHCLNCGHHLQASGEVAPSEVPSTAIIALCPTCGERIDPGSVYCKGCGAALYEQPTPFGQSAIICAACQSFNPVGSTTCRVCGASLIVTAGAMADQTPTQVVSEKNSDTLPDLADHLAIRQSGEHRQPTGEHASLPPPPLERGSLPESLSDSGAYTLSFDAQRTDAMQTPGTEVFQDNATSAVQSSLPTVPPHTKGGDTSVLPGVAGSRFEQPQPTASLNMGRDTGPVEEEIEASDEAPASGELIAPLADESSSPAAPGVRQNTDELVAQSSPPPALHETFTFASDVDATPPAGTVALGAGSAPPAGFDNQSEPFVAHDETTQAMGSVAPTESIQEAVRRFERLPQATLPIEQAAPPAFGQSNVHYPVAAAPAVPVVPAPRKKRRAGWFAGIFITLFVIGIAFGAWWFLFARKTAAPVTPARPTETPSVPAKPTEEPKPSAPVAPEGMVLVAAGSYTVGRDDANDVEKPQHTVTLPAYFIDRTEVTNEAYKQFVDATNHKPPTNWSGNNFPTGRANYPVTGITWQDAADYAAWAGKRLPTEAEWEAAARGPEGRRYTWGNEWLPGQANIGVQVSEQAKDDEYPPQIMAVGGFPQGASPAGALDMIGNVWEWTADEFKFYAGNAASLDDPKVKAEMKLKPGVTYRVIRGGAFDGDQPHDGSYRGWIDASRAYPKTGFRCVKDVK